jgi:hypothetical protein
MLPNGVSAQRTLPGQKGIQFIGGTINGMNPQDGFHTGIAFFFFFKGANKWVFGLEYFEKQHPYRDIKIPQAQFTADGGYYLNFLSDANKIFFASVGASAVAGYETVNWNKKRLSDGATITDKDNFLYGGALTLEVETYLTDRLVLVANARERFLAGSSTRKLNALFGIGIKFIIN